MKEDSATYVLLDAVPAMPRIFARFAAQVTIYSKVSASAAALVALLAMVVLVSLAQVVLL